MIKKISLCILVAVLLFMSDVYANTGEFDVDAVSAILVEASTGKVMYEKNADSSLPPASVTKVMTMLLVIEAVDGGVIKLSDMVQTSENAASMGGSQIYLKVGEEMTVEDMLKSVVIASANDAAVALAEFICGSEEAFVSRMNERGAELGLENTHFENTNGLDDDTVNHVMSARDIAVITRELLRHPKILDYSSIWMDTVRNGEFGLTNTNRLVRFYSGANGLKTGSTSKAKFCISATAKRDGMQLIAVIMASPTRDTRNEAAKKLFDYGFANYSYINIESGTLDNLRVLGGVTDKCGVIYGSFETVLDKGADKNIETTVNLPETLSAPIKLGQKIGKVEYSLNGEKIGEADIVTCDEVSKISYFGLFGKLIKKFLLI